MKHAIHANDGLATKTAIDSRIMKKNGAIHMDKGDGNKIDEVGGTNISAAPNRA